MLLRVSGSATKTRVDLEALLADEESDCGVPGGALLRRFALRVIRGDIPDRIAPLRLAVAAELGTEATVDAAAVAAFFNAFDRIADATGTNPDEPTMQLLGQWLPGLQPHRPQ